MIYFTKGVIIMSNLELIKVLSQLVEEQNEIIQLLSGKLKEAGVPYEDVRDRVLNAHQRYIELLGTDEVPDNLP